VVLDEQELREIEMAARRERMTTSEWVRQALRAARRARPGGDSGRKLALVRRAARHSFPTADIDEMLGDIERGRTGETSSTRTSRCIWSAPTTRTRPPPNICSRRPSRAATVW
jgi:hypothetical protein